MAGPAVAGVLTSNASGEGDEDSTVEVTLGDGVVSVLMSNAPGGGDEDTPVEKTLGIGVVVALDGVEALD